MSDIDQEPDEKISVTGKDGSLTSALLGALENINQHNLYSDSDEEGDDQDDDDEWSDWIAFLLFFFKCLIFKSTLYE